MKGEPMGMSYDSEAKKAWDRENMVFVGFKLFRSVKDKQNDQDIIDFLEGKVKGEVIKDALREYISNHKGETE
jgi:predicted RNA-binding protein